MQHFICYCSYHTLDEGFFSHFISICFLHKFREVFLFYILQPCSGQTFSFSFELASAVFNSLIYFDNDLIIFKNFKFILLNFINITSRSYLVDQKLLFFFFFIGSCFVETLFGDFMIKPVFNSYLKQRDTF